MFPSYNKYNSIMVIPTHVNLIGFTIIWQMGYGTCIYLYLNTRNDLELYVVYRAVI